MELAKDDKKGDAMNYEESVGLNRVIICDKARELE
jgi:hypothetical protein